MRPRPQEGIGEPWLIELVPSDGELRQFAPLRPVGGAPAEPFPPSQVTAMPSAEGYEAMVATAVDRIRGGALRKVVLARTMQVEAGRSLDPLRLAHRLRAVDPHAFTFVTALDEPQASSSGGCIARVARLQAWARRPIDAARRFGSSLGRPGEDRANAEALLASAKNREEHAIVVEAIEDVLGMYCEHLDHDPEPVLVETANVWHLATRFQGTLRDPSPGVVELVAALHPDAGGGWHADRDRQGRHRRTRTVRSWRLRGSGGMDGCRGRRRMGDRPSVRPLGRSARDALCRRGHRSRRCATDCGPAPKTASEDSRTPG